MKKLSLMLIFFLVQSFCLFAQDTPSDGNTSKKTQKKKSSFMDRSFEIGFANLNINLANNFLSVTDFFHEVIIIDLDKLASGFKLNLGVNVTPLYFTFKTKNDWGFGLTTNIESFGILNLSGNLLNINEAVKDNSDISAAVFSSVTVNTFYNVRKIKVKFNPSLFYTLAYVTPPSNKSSSLIYTLDYSNGTVMSIDYSVRVYKGYSLDDHFSLTSRPGLDFTIGFEYPLAKEIELTKYFPFLDFDIGLDFINIPFFPSTISDYTQIKGQIGKDTPIKLINKDDDDGESFLSPTETIKGRNQIKVIRPFKVITRADWRPLFGGKFFTVTPVIGFCYNVLYYEPFSLEAGLNVGLNFGNLFSIKAGYNYTDRMFVNNLGFAINLKVCEIDIGADLRSQKADQVWKGSGVGINFGLKFGW